MFAACCLAVGYMLIGFDCLLWYHFRRLSVIISWVNFDPLLLDLFLLFYFCIQLPFFSLHIRYATYNFQLIDFTSVHSPCSYHSFPHSCLPQCFLQSNRLTSFFLYFFTYSISIIICPFHVKRNYHSKHLLSHSHQLGYLRIIRRPFKTPRIRTMFELNNPKLKEFLPCALQVHFEFGRKLAIIGCPVAAIHQGGKIDQTMVISLFQTSELQCLVTHWLNKYAKLYTFPSQQCCINQSTRASITCFSCWRRELAHHWRFQWLRM